MATLTLKVNGRARTVDVDPATPLLFVLSDDLDLRGPKFGCGLGQCGSCTVISNGQAIRSCITPVSAVTSAEITTLEGIGQPENLHPVQAAFVACDAYQCGYCTPGQIMSAVALLKEPCGPDDAEVKEFMSGNICRCGAYPNIVAAIQSVRQNVKPQKAG